MSATATAAGSTTAIETTDDAVHTNTAATTPAGLRCAGSVLRAGLAVVAGAVPTGALTLPAVGGVHISVGEDGRSATLAATDLEVRIAHTVALDGGRAGVALAPFGKLRDLAATMPDGLAALVGLGWGEV